MNIKEGERRLNAALTWIVAIFIWIPFAIAIIIFAIKREGLAGVISGSFISFIFLTLFGIVIRDVGFKIVMWVIKGFVGEEKASSSNDVRQNQIEI